LTEYYCSQKFWWLTVEPERRSMNSCCAAQASKIDLTWLSKNSGRLFNSPELLKEREAMLNNEPVASCEDTCWSAERRGLPSRRTMMRTQDRTHTDVYTTPRVLHINLGSDCNLTCSYCCKQYSTAWLRDIDQQGPYLDDARYVINNNDRIVLKLGQNAIKNSDAYQQIVREVQKFQSVEQIEISGGEPFLYNGLPDLVKSLHGPVDIFTGLGVNADRLQRVMNQLPKHTTFTVSAENTGALYEFNRYGNTWSGFQRNLDELTKKFAHRFCSVLSNLTIHGLADFQQQYGNDNNIMNACTDPDYLSASVLDPESKKRFNEIEYKYQDREIKQTLKADYTEQQKQKLRVYVTGFVQRRNLSLDVFPENFLTWLHQP